MNQGYSYGAEAPEVYKRKEPKKVGWLTRWFDRKCQEAWHRAQNQPAEPRTYASAVVSRHGGLDSNGLNLNIYGADGGMVLEFRHYDNIKDRNEYALHVISQSDNFEECVAQAITMEMLRKGISK